MAWTDRLATLSSVVRRSQDDKSPIGRGTVANQPWDCGRTMTNRSCLGADLARQHDLSRRYVYCTFLVLGWQSLVLSVILLLDGVRQLLRELLSGVKADALQSMVHGSHFNDDREVSAWSDRNGQ